MLVVLATLATLTSRVWGGCGNGVVESSRGEECDNPFYRKECVKCSVTPGYFCYGSPSLCVPATPTASNATVQLIVSTNGTLQKDAFVGVLNRTMRSLTNGTVARVNNTSDSPTSVTVFLRFNSTMFDRVQRLFKWGNTTLLASLNTTAPPVTVFLNSVCGDGIVQLDEYCDTKNMSGCVGCQTASDGTACSYFRGGVACTPCGVVGDSGYDANGVEECDDNNTISDDGCTRCVVDVAFECYRTPDGISRCSKCGDGHIDSDERCDDGNLVRGDGCSADCTIEPGFLCTGSAGGKSVCNFFCGNGVLEPSLGEVCEDGNRNVGDGCSRSCTVEPGWKCENTLNNGTRSQCIHYCGNGFVDPWEECDDGNNLDADGCDPVCRYEDRSLGWQCSIQNNRSLCNCSREYVCSTFKNMTTNATSTSCRKVKISGCQNGISEGCEECDDANNFGNDGCSRTCTVEPGWYCTRSINHHSSCTRTTTNCNQDVLYSCLSAKSLNLSTVPARASRACPWWRSVMKCVKESQCVDDAVVGGPFSALCNEASVRFGCDLDCYSVVDAQKVSCSSYDGWYNQITTTCLISYSYCINQPGTGTARRTCTCFRGYSRCLYIRGLQCLPDALLTVCNIMLDSIKRASVIGQCTDACIDSLRSYADITNSPSVRTWYIGLFNAEKFANEVLTAVNASADVILDVSLALPAKVVFRTLDDINADLMGSESAKNWSIEFQFSKISMIEGEKLVQQFMAQAAAGLLDGIGVPRQMPIIDYTHRGVFTNGNPTGPLASPFSLTVPARLPITTPIRATPAPSPNNPSANSPPLPGVPYGPAVPYGPSSRPANPAPVKPLTVAFSIPKAAMPLPSILWAFAAGLCLAFMSLA